MTDLGKSITIDGDARFQARVESDLATYNSTPLGRELLASLDGSSRDTKIMENDIDRTITLSKDGSPYDPGNGASAIVMHNSTGTYSDGRPAWLDVPPVTNLFHELVHAQDYTNGTLAEGESQEPGIEGKTENKELDAVGLDWDKDGDGINDPNTRPITENKYRLELGLVTRPSYRE